MKHGYDKRSAEAATVNDVTALLRFLAPRARKVLASRGVCCAAWDAVREAENIVNGHGPRSDPGDRFEVPSLDRPGVVERLRLLARVLTRHAV